MWVLSGAIPREYHIEVGNGTTVSNNITKTGPLALSTLLNVGAENTKARTNNRHMFWSKRSMSTLGKYSSQQSAKVQKQANVSERTKRLFLRSVDGEIRWTTTA